MIPEAVVAMLACARIGAAALRRLRRLLRRRRSPPASRTPTPRSSSPPTAATGAASRPRSSPPSTRRSRACRRRRARARRAPHRPGRRLGPTAATCGGTRSSSRQSAEHTPEAFDAEHPLFILYTSGTTGKPKGILHTSGGYLTQAAYTHHAVFDLKPETDVYWCTADIGWVTGHSYIVYGPLANGATQVMYEGTPDTPHQGRFWEIVQKYGVTILYTRAHRDPHVHEVGRRHPREVRPVAALRVLGSVGEPINPEAWIWYREHIGGDRCPIVDTWWQTETGAIMISPAARRHRAKPGSAHDAAARHRGRPSSTTTAARCPTAAAATWSSPSRGRRCCAPSGATTSAIIDTYWSRFAGMYFAGDGAKKDDDGDIWLLGRVDDVMIVSGHSISTTEVESALVSHPTVAEAAVVGAADATTGQAIVAFVILRGTRARTSDEDLVAELRDHVAKELGPIAKPQQILRRRSCPRPAPARSCAACCGTWPRTASSATSPR